MIKKEIEKQAQPPVASEEKKHDQEVEKESKAVEVDSAAAAVVPEGKKQDQEVVKESKTVEADNAAAHVVVEEKKQVHKRSKDTKVVEVKNNTSFLERGDTAEIKEVLVSVNRTTKVVKGGRRFSFAAVVVAGDGQGRVGHGLGKANEILDARSKAAQSAKKTMIKVPLKDNRTIFHDIEGKFGAGHVILRSAKVGTGIIAGGPMRSIFEMLGVHDIVAKSKGSSNVHNIIGATFDALKNLHTPDYIRRKRMVA